MTSEVDVAPANDGASEQARDVSGPGTVHRAVRILSAIADAGGEVRLSTLAHSLGLAVSTTHRMLQLLRTEGMVEWRASTRSYAVGAGFYRLAARVVSAVPAPKVAQPHLNKLTQRFGETTIFALALPADPAMLFAAKADGAHALQYRLQMNTPLSLIWGASGKAILAFLPPDIVERALKREQTASASGEPPPNEAALAIALERVREAGYAASVGEKLAGARGVAAPVFGPHGILGCLCITAPADRTSDKAAADMAKALIAEAGELSWALGARGFEYAQPKEF